MQASAPHCSPPWVALLAVAALGAGGAACQLLHICMTGANKRSLVYSGPTMTLRQGACGAVARLSACCCCGNRLLHPCLHIRAGVLHALKTARNRRGRHRGMLVNCRDRTATEPNQSTLAGAQLATKPE